MNKIFIATALVVLMLSGHVFAASSPDAMFTSPKILASDTSITADLCDQSGNNLLVVCSNAVAMALHNVHTVEVAWKTNETIHGTSSGKLGVSFSSVAGGCVQDNITGLMWEVKTTDGGLRDWNNTYTNFDSTAAAQKHDFASGALSNPTQAEIDAPGNSVGFKNQVNRQRLCGFNDWRLPTAEELQSILDYSVASPEPPFDALWFPHTVHNYFWSTSSVVGDSDYAWIVDFHDGSVIDDFRSFSGHVRLVRAGKQRIPNRYTASVVSLRIKDNQTGLIWRRCAEGMVYSGGICTGKARRFTHEEALLLVDAQAINSGTAWRLPNIKELASIVDRSRVNPAIDLEAFPGTPASSFWSASSLSQYTAWGVGFGNGVIRGGSRRGRGYVRLVRSSE